MFEENGKCRYLVVNDETQVVVGSFESSEDRIKRFFSDPEELTMRTALNNVDDDDFYLANNEFTNLLPIEIRSTVTGQVLYTITLDDPRDRFIEFYNKHCDQAVYATKGV